MTVVESVSVTISCTSVGAPAPSITWELNDMPAPFTSTTTEIGSQDGLARNEDGSLVRDGDGNTVFIALNTIISSLQIINAQYPDHDGDYTCIGSNDDQMVNTSSATITVQVLGECIADVITILSPY